MKFLVIISTEGYVPSVEWLMPDTEKNRKYLLDYLNETTAWKNKTPENELSSGQLYFNQEDEGSMDNAVQLDIVEMHEVKE
jgi:hypothetical protein